MNKKIHFKDIEGLIAETLDMGKSFKIAPNGISMLPLIKQGRDKVYISRPQGRLKKYDIAFYKRPTGQFVLHRIIKVRTADYIICGDNQWVPEYGITDENIIGVVNALEINGEYMAADNPKLKRYAFWRVNTRIIRNFKKILLTKASVIYHKIKKDR